MLSPLRSSPLRSSPLRICFLCNDYPPGPHGGIGTMTQVLGRALVQAGHQVRVVGVYPPAYPAAAYEEDQGVRIWRLRAPGSRARWIVARYKLFRAIARWIRQGEVDLVDVPDWQGWAAAWPRLPVPVIARLNGSSSYFAAEMGQSLSRIPFLLERASLRRADFWCSVSRYTADRTQQLFGLRCGPRAILYNPIEVPESPVGPGFTTRSANQVIFTGTLLAKKGIASLVKAWPRVIEVCPEAELHVFGKDGTTADGQSMRAFLLSQLNLMDNRVGESVRFHGHVAREQLFRVLRTARVAVFPSYAEAFALAPLEAMIRGCPTIYSRLGSGPELIEHGRSGLLVDPDQPAEIADAILRVLRDDQLAKRLGDDGRQRVRENFSIEALLSQNEAFYRGCLMDFGRAPVRVEAT